MSKIVEQFHRVCQEKSDKPAFYDDAKNQVVCKTFAQTEQDVARAVRHLQGSGVKPGDRLLTFTDPNYDLIIYFLAAFQIGAVVMRVDASMSQDLLENLFAKFAPQYVLLPQAAETQYKKSRAINKIRKVVLIDNPDKTQPLEFNQKYLSVVADDKLALLTTAPSVLPGSKIDSEHKLDNDSEISAYAYTYGNLWDQLETSKKNSEPCAVKGAEVYMHILANLLQGQPTILGTM